MVSHADPCIVVLHGEHTIGMQLDCESVPSSCPNFAGDRTIEITMNASSHQNLLCLILRDMNRSPIDAVLSATSTVLAISWSRTMGYSKTL